jgi:hypothetical protein
MEIDNEKTLRTAAISTTEPFYTKRLTSLAGREAAAVGAAAAAAGEAFGCRP